FPTTAQRGAVEITLVADEVAFDALHARGHDAICEVVDAFEVIATVEARGKRRITATIDDEIAFDFAVVRFFFRVHRSNEMKVGRQSIERSRDRIELHVRSRPHKLVRVLFEDHLPRVERNNLYRKETGFERRLFHDLFDPTSEIGE